jgi:secondary thiamine-phosphate synthase enzyme
MKQLHISTKKKSEVIDITSEISKVVPAQGAGTLNVFVQHTTAAITAMDLDPGTDLDFLDFIDSLVPNINWRHLHDPSHSPDHMLASLIGPSLTVPYSEGRLMLGDWQHIVLVECDGPKTRSVIVT